MGSSLTGEQVTRECWSPRENLPALHYWSASLLPLIAYLHNLRETPFQSRESLEPEWPARSVSVKRKKLHNTCFQQGINATSIMNIISEEKCSKAPEFRKWQAFQFSSLRLQVKRGGCHSAVLLRTCLTLSLRDRQTIVFFFRL